MPWKKNPCKGLIAHNMSTYLFRCPNTGPRVQGLSAEVPVSVNSAYEAITCLAS